LHFFLSNEGKKDGKFGNNLFICDRDSADTHSHTIAQAKLVLVHGMIQRGRKEEKQLKAYKKLC
jgi:hypothetical protein